MKRHAFSPSRFSKENALSFLCVALLAAGCSNTKSLTSTGGTITPGPTSPIADPNGNNQNRNGQGQGNNQGQGNQNQGPTQGSQSETIRSCYFSKNHTLTICDQTNKPVMTFENVVTYAVSGTAVGVNTVDFRLPPDQQIPVFSVTRMDGKKILDGVKNPKFFQVSATLVGYADQDGNGEILNLEGKSLRKISKNDLDIAINDSYAIWHNGFQYSILTYDGEIKTSSPMPGGIKRISASSSILSILSGNDTLTVQELDRKDPRGFSQKFDNAIDVFSSNQYVVVERAHKNSTPEDIGVTIFQKPSSQVYKEDKGIKMAAASGAYAAVLTTKGKAFLFSNGKKSEVCKDCTEIMVSAHFAGFKRQNGELIIYRVGHEKPLRYSQVERFFVTDWNVGIQLIGQREIRILEVEICESITLTRFFQIPGSQGTGQQGTPTSGGAGVGMGYGGGGCGFGGFIGGGMCMPMLPTFGGLIGFGSGFPCPSFGNYYGGGPYYGGPFNGGIGGNIGLGMGGMPVPMMPMTPYIPQIPPMMPPMMPPMYPAGGGGGYFNPYCGGGIGGGGFGYGFGGGGAGAYGGFGNYGFSAQFGLPSYYGMYRMGC